MFGSYTDWAHLLGSGARTVKRALKPEETDEMREDTQTRAGSVYDHLVELINDYYNDVDTLPSEQRELFKFPSGPALLSDYAHKLRMYYDLIAMYNNIQSAQSIDEVVTFLFPVDWQHTMWNDAAGTVYVEYTIMFMHAEFMVDTLHADNVQRRTENPVPDETDHIDELVLDFWENTDVGEAVYELKGSDDTENRAIGEEIWANWEDKVSYYFSLFEGCVKSILATWTQVHDSIEPGEITGYAEINKKTTLDDFCKQLWMRKLRISNNRNNTIMPMFSVYDDDLSDTDIQKLVYPHGNQQSFDGIRINYVSFFNNSVSWFSTNCFKEDSCEDCYMSSYDSSVCTMAHMEAGAMICIAQEAVTPGFVQWLADENLSNRWSSNILKGIKPVVITGLIGYAAYQYGMVGQTTEELQGSEFSSDETNGVCALLKSSGLGKYEMLAGVCQNFVSLAAWANKAEEQITGTRRKQLTAKLYRKLKQQIPSDMMANLDAVWNEDALTEPVITEIKRMAESFNEKGPNRELIEYLRTEKVLTGLDTVRTKPRYLDVTENERTIASVLVTYKNLVTIKVKIAEVVNEVVEVVEDTLEEHDIANVDEAVSAVTSDLIVRGEIAVKKTVRGIIKQIMSSPVFQTVNTMLNRPQIESSDTRGPRAIAASELVLNYNDTINKHLSSMYCFEDSYEWFNSTNGKLMALANGAKNDSGPLVHTVPVVIPEKISTQVDALQAEQEKIQTEMDRITSVTEDVDFKDLESALGKLENSEEELTDTLTALRYSKDSAAAKLTQTKSHEPTRDAAIEEAKLAKEQATQEALEGMKTAQKAFDTIYNSTIDFVNYTKLNGNETKADVQTNSKNFITKMPAKDAFVALAKLKAILADMDKYETGVFYSDKYNALDTVRLLNTRSDTFKKVQETLKNNYIKLMSFKIPFRFNSEKEIITGNDEFEVLTENGLVDDQYKNKDANQTQIMENFRKTADDFFQLIGYAHTPSREEYIDNIFDRDANTLRDTYVKSLFGFKKAKQNNETTMERIQIDEETDKTLEISMNKTTAQIDAVKEKIENVERFQELLTNYTDTAAALETLEEVQTSAASTGEKTQEQQRQLLEQTAEGDEVEISQGTAFCVMTNITPLVEEIAITRNAQDAFTVATQTMSNITESFYEPLATELKKTSNDVDNAVKAFVVSPTLANKSNVRDTVTADAACKLKDSAKDIDETLKEARHKLAQCGIDGEELDEQSFGPETWTLREVCKCADEVCGTMARMLSNTKEIKTNADYLTNAYQMAQKWAATARDAAEKVTEYKEKLSDAASDMYKNVWNEEGDHTTDYDIEAEQTFVMKSNVAEDKFFNCVGNEKFYEAMQAITQSYAESQARSEAIEAHSDRMKVMGLDETELMILASTRAARDMGKHIFNVYHALNETKEDDFSNPFTGEHAERNLKSARLMLYAISSGMQGKTAETLVHVTRLAATVISGTNTSIPMTEVSSLVALLSEFGTYKNLVDMSNVMTAKFASIIMWMVQSPTLIDSITCGGTDAPETELDVVLEKMSLAYAAYNHMIFDNQLKNLAFKAVRSEDSELMVLNRASWKGAGWLNVQAISNFFPSFVKVSVGGFTIYVARRSEDNKRLVCRNAIRARRYYSLLTTFERPLEGLAGYALYPGVRLVRGSLPTVAQAGLLVHEVGDALLQKQAEIHLKNFLWDTLGLGDAAQAATKPV